MNTQVKAANNFEIAKKDFVRHDRARLVAELDAERQKSKNARNELVYSKRFYRGLVLILVLLSISMYGGLWYAKAIYQAGCF